jgi:ADP-ribose 1''-phosphate phosphatase
MSKLTYITGDIFTAPPNTILVHACNTQGFWGAGIALSFREKYPAQFKLYKAHCGEHGDALVGTCLLISGETHDIACLFTSRGFGRRKDSPEEILNATETAVKDLMEKNVQGKELHSWCVP